MQTVVPLFAFLSLQPKHVHMKISFLSRIGRILFAVLLASLLCFFILLIIARWAANTRETLAYGVDIPENGSLLDTTEGTFFLLETGQKGNTPVIFAHGTAAWSGLWQPTLDAVADAGFHATAFDMPPFGWSQHPAGQDFSRSKQAERVIALFEALDNRPIVVAHSIGAGPVGEAVLRRPDLVSALVIVDGAIALGSHEDPKGLPYFLRNDAFREYVTAATISNPYLTGTFLRQFIHVKESATPEVVSLLRRPLKRQGYTDALNDWLPQLFETPQDALSTRSASWQALDLPVALIWGQSDTITPMDQADELTALIPGARLSVLKGVGHIPQIEDPEVFQTSLIEVLHTLSNRASEEINE